MLDSLVALLGIRVLQREDCVIYAVSVMLSGNVLMTADLWRSLVSFVRQYL